MSSLLYQLSYSLKQIIGKKKIILSLYADKGFAPLFTGHEPVMLLLHQSAYDIYLEKKR
jgi:hypothetical protein